jgi:hypothetical protein
VSKGYHPNGSASGALPENEQPDYVMIELNALNTRLWKGKKLRYSTKDEKALEDLSVQGSAITDEFLSKYTSTKFLRVQNFGNGRAFVRL